MRFRGQWFAGLGTLIALIATTAITGIVSLHLMRERADYVIRDYGNDLARVQRLRYANERLVATSRGYLLSGEPALHAQFEAERAGVLRVLGELAVSRPESEALVHATLDYVAESSRVVAERAAAVDATAILPVFDQTLVPRGAELEADIAAFAQRRRDVFEDALQAVDAAVERAQFALVLAALLAIASGFGLTTIVSRRLSRQFREIEAATAAAEQAAKAREEVLAVVSHDLRNPLQAIAMSATLVEETTREPAAHAYLHTIHNATTRMGHMIDELLEVSRIDHNQIELHREPVSSSELLDEAVELFRDTAKAQHVELIYEAPAHQVLADRERVLEVLSNLLGNALKFSPPAARISARAKQTGDSMRFEIVDAGPGIAPEQLPHLFDRFWQGDRRKRREGLGLGLYICKRLVEAHHGSIGCDSAPGAGSTFWFTLPAVAPASGRATV